MFRNYNVIICANNVGVFGCNTGTIIRTIWETSHRSAVLCGIYVLLGLIHYFIVQHFLSLPGFALMYSDISASVTRFNESTPMELPLIGMSVPSMWIYLLANDVAQCVIEFVD